MYDEALKCMLGTLAVSAFGLCAFVMPAEIVAI